ncbi:MAG: adenylyltransferase/cytidyltransferase family protein [Candidatus Liptonbacteria bacterium]|nr:adenylyltransferase/cytidyltransferase family protein [Candidatus Liptonbacteria bacterium]
MAKIAFKDLEHIREKHRGQKIVYTSGGFDLTHAGHVLFFEDAKKHGDVLVVMVGSDKAVRRDKGNTRPVQNEHIRMKMIDSLKPVDYTMTDEDELVPPGKHPLHFVEMVFEKLRPDAYVVNEDAFDIPHRKEFAKKHGVELIILERWCPQEFEKISTSGIIKKIKESN